MEFKILGPFEVSNERGAVALGGAKSRAVLAVLLLNANEPVSAERLALALWGEDAPAGAVKAVQVHVSRLRKALGDFAKSFGVELKMSGTFSEAVSGRQSSTSAASYWVPAYRRARWNSALVESVVSDPPMSHSGPPMSHVAIQV